MSPRLRVSPQCLNHRIYTPRALPTLTSTQACTHTHTRTFARGNTVWPMVSATCPHLLGTRYSHGSSSSGKLLAEGLSQCLGVQACAQALLEVPGT